MKDTFIKYKDRLLPFHLCQVFSDCIRFVEFDIFDNKEEIIIPNGEWEYVEVERKPNSMTLNEWIDYQNNNAIDEFNLAKFRRYQFLELNPDLPEDYIGELWREYCRNNPIM